MMFMMYLITTPLLGFFGCLLYAMYQAGQNTTTNWQIPPYDWDFEDEELWITQAELLDYQRRED
jgi:hypothetical protein